MSRLSRLSLSPDPNAASASSPHLIGPPPVYKSGLILQQQERNSPSYQTYRQKNHDYVNTEYILHTGSLATRAQSSTPQKGIVSKRSAAFEAFVQGTLQNSPHVQNQAVPNLISVNHHQQSSAQQATTVIAGHKTSFQMVKPTLNGSINSAFHHIKQKTAIPAASASALLNNYENYTLRSPNLRASQSATPTFTSSFGGTIENGHQIQHQPVKVILSNGTGSSHSTPTPSTPTLPTAGSSYQSTIENKVKLLSQQNPNQTYVSNMHVRVPSQESSVYSDSRTYINLGQPVAIASRGGILMNPSQSQLNNRVAAGGGHSGVTRLNASVAAKMPAIPRSQVVKAVMEPSYSSLLQNQGEQNQAIYANFEFRSSDGSNTEEEVAYTSPPSPVSSSYSELRVATRAPMEVVFQHPQQLHHLQQMNPQAMIYDPLYEPISGQSSVSNQHKPNFGLGGLSSHYDDSFGPCSKCLEPIVGEGTGCSAMGRLYHIKCFTCQNCGCQLQGKPFYALDGKV